MKGVTCVHVRAWTVNCKNLLCWGQFELKINNPILRFNDGVNMLWTFVNIRKNHRLSKYSFKMIKCLLKVHECSQVFTSVHVGDWTVNRNDFFLLSIWVASKSIDNWFRGLLTGWTCCEPLWTYKKNIRIVRIRELVDRRISSFNVVSNFMRVNGFTNVHVVEWTVNCTHF